MKLQNILVLCFLIFSLSSCSPETANNTPQSVSIGTPFQMNVGEVVSFDEGHYLTFARVASDSRCPVNAQCIWQGEATIVLIPYDGKSSAEVDTIYPEVSLSTQTTDAFTYLAPEKDRNTFGYVVSLNSLSPTPEVGKEIQESDYVATLTISLSE